MSKSHRYLLGYDIGSSSVKAALVDAGTGSTIYVSQSPTDAMPVIAQEHGWAEQDPEMWWSHVCIATRDLLQRTGIDAGDIQGIGIAYQMHGLVCIDRNMAVLRPAIIWCDSRAVATGEVAFENIGAEKCMYHLLNAPGNFTASKLGWVKKHEPEIYEHVHKFMLPGDYIAMKLTGEITTTPAGLSEGMLWDFRHNSPADIMLDHFGFDKELLPEVIPVFSLQGEVNGQAAHQTGLVAGIPVGYRAGDQPNNALALGVLQPGDIAASGGTSGVVYGVASKPVFDTQSRVNSFMHVNHTPESARIGILLCINGAGSQYNWIKQHIAESGTSYSQMEQEASAIPVGSDGLRLLPFGNGAERMLGNRDVGAHMLHLDFNRHGRAHLYRAALEGIAFAFVYGLRIMQEMGLNVQTIRVGNDNLFQSDIFSKTIATLTGSTIDVIETTGAAGAARAAGVVTDIFSSVEEAMDNIEIWKSYEPEKEVGPYQNLFSEWKGILTRFYL